MKSMAFVMQALMVSLNVRSSCLALSVIRLCISGESLMDVSVSVMGFLGRPIVID